jgi:hypothetical protein
MPTRRQLSVEPPHLAKAPRLSYDSNMETVIHQVHELGNSERSAAEQLVGHPSHDNQQLVIQVVTPAQNAVADEAASNRVSVLQLPEDESSRDGSIGQRTKTSLWRLICD